MAVLQQLTTNVERRGAKLEWQGAQLEWRGAQLEWQGAQLERLGAQLEWQGAQLEETTSLLDSINRDVGSVAALLDSINRDVGSVAETAVRVASVLASSATYPAHRAFRTGGAGHTVIASGLGEGWLIGLHFGRAFLLSFALHSAAAACSSSSARAGLG
jgi:hypothetical protein